MSITGGFTLANAITKYSPFHHITILEAAKELTELGAGVTIYPNGLKIMDYLDLDVRSSKGGNSCPSNIHFDMETGEETPAGGKGIFLTLFLLFMCLKSI